MNTLSRSVTLTQALMINLGAIIGAGIFVIIGVAIGHAGPSIIISIILLQNRQYLCELKKVC